MEEIRPSNQAFWKITKALKTEGYTPIPALKIPNGSIALDDAEVAECIADSIETQFSHVSPPHDIAHINGIDEEVLQKTSLEPKDDLTPVSLSEVQTLVKSISTRKVPGLDGVSNKAIKCFSQPLLSLLVAILTRAFKIAIFLRLEVGGGNHPQARETSPPCQLQTDQPPEWSGKLFESVLKTRLSNHLFGKGLIIDEQFSFRPAHSCPQQVLRLVEYVSEGFKTKQKTVAVFFDLAKAFNKSRSSARLRPLSPPVLRVHQRHNASTSVGVTFDKNLHFREHIARVRKNALFCQQGWSHAGRKASYRRKAHALQNVHWTVMTAATDAYWCVRNSILHRDMELPTLTKYMKDASKRFFDIAGSHPNALLRAAVDYQPPPPTHFLRRLRNVLIDPPDALTAAVDSLNDVNDTHD
ncbi:Probable RNA-directed DNA polymerase from transposon BS [Eumeta japonica]|uniref:Probable RNA-directed DNA polymerase from transposon BS n=1 Tax=Eumeta variegata TaxID=151549 RepID=A0A4C1TIV4_EUMVA|nr:Probable RNA-directed DNA polymerase from transposon BS [Eumeta japonica]